MRKWSHVDQQSINITVWKMFQSGTWVWGRGSIKQCQRKMFSRLLRWWDLWLRFRPKLRSLHWHPGIPRHLPAFRLHRRQLPGTASWRPAYRLSPAPSVCVQTHPSQPAEIHIRSQHYNQHHTVLLVGTHLVHAEKCEISWQLFENMPKCHGPFSDIDTAKW